MSEDSYFIQFPGMKLYDGCSRLLPRSTSHSIEEGIQAKWKGPYWGLARQWQLGKFRAINGGKMVRSEVSIKNGDLDGIKFGTDNDFQELANSDLPLEPLVEQEEIRTSEPSTQPKSWSSQNLEYQFAVKTGNTIFEAKDFPGDQLDWYDFDLGSQISFEGRKEDFSLMPAEITFQGQTGSCWWEIEEGNVDLGDIRRPNLNFLSMLLIEYALIYSNDWFAIPIQQKAGSLRSVENLIVVDTFGLFEKINPIIDTSPDEHLWSIFTLSGGNGFPNAGSQIFLLPNTVTHVLKGEPIEQLSISRDELANIVWAIEHKYYSQGEVVNRDDAEAAKAPDPPTVEANPLYRLKSYLPSNWIPYVPIRKSPEGGVILRRGRTNEKASSDPLTNETQYRGQILRESIRINEEEVPAIDIELTRKFKLIGFRPEEWELIEDQDLLKWKLMRTKSKEIYVWLGRNKKPGKRVGSSRLKFDFLLEK